MSHGQGKPQNGQGNVREKSGNFVRAHGWTPWTRKSLIIAHNALENGAWFWLMTVAWYIALPLISRYHCLDPTNRDILRVHCILTTAHHHRAGNNSGCLAILIAGLCFGAKNSFPCSKKVMCVCWLNGSIWYRYQNVSVSVSISKKRKDMHPWLVLLTCYPLIILGMGSVNKTIRDLHCK